MHTLIYTRAAQGGAWTQTGVCVHGAGLSIAIWLAIDSRPGWARRRWRKTFRLYA